MLPDFQLILGIAIGIPIGAVLGEVVKPHLAHWLRLIDRGGA